MQYGRKVERKAKMGKAKERKEEKAKKAMVRDNGSQKEERTKEKERTMGRKELPKAKPSRAIIVARQATWQRTVGQRGSKSLRIRA